MSRERPERLEDLFHTAREMNPAERSRYLNEECGSDPATRRVVDTLLREDARAGGPLDGSISDSVATALSPGMVVGPYEVVSVAGIGGMGQVYRAIDRRLKREVAIKVLPVEFAHDRERMERLRGEATVLASLNNPNVAAIYDVIERPDEPPGLVMEFVSGDTLAELLRNGPVGVASALRIAHQIAAALEAAHAKGIVHRDLKPSNIKLTPDAKVKVLDFGLARVLTDTHAGPASGPGQRETFFLRNSGLAGTPSYMGPEQKQGLPVDQRADIWSFGCIVYELLTGQKAFSRGTGEHTPSPALPGEPDWAVLPTDTPSGLRRLLQQCLQGGPPKRPKDGSSLRQAVEDLEKALPAASALRGLRTGGRVRWKAAAVLVLVVAVAGGGIGAWSWPRARGPLPSQAPAANRSLAMAMDAARLGQAARARELVLQALDLDPQFAYARAMYAFSLVLDVDGGSSSSRDPRDLLNRAELELRRALGDDPNSAEAHAVLAFVYYYQGRKDLMRQAAERSLDLDPANRDAKVHLAFFYQLNGDYAESQAILREVIASGSSDPSAPVVMAAGGNYAENLREMGDFAGAIREYDRMFRQEPRALGSRVLLAQAYQTAGKRDESRRLLEGAPPADRTNPMFRLTWALQLALDGKRDEARREMEDGALQRYAELVFYSLYAAEIYALLGDPDTAMSWLNRGFRAGDERAEWLERDPHLASLYNDPRFRQLTSTIRERRAPGVLPRWFRWFGAQLSNVTDTRLKTDQT